MDINFLENKRRMEVIKRKYSKTKERRGKKLCNTEVVDSNGKGEVNDELT